MMHPETLEAYRRMTPSERFKITMDLLRANARRIFEGPEEVVNRRFELLRKQNDERNQRMLEGIARTRHNNG